MTTSVGGSRLKVCAGGAPARLPLDSCVPGEPHPLASHFDPSATRWHCEPAFHRYGRRLMAGFPVTGDFQLKSVGTR